MKLLIVAICAIGARAALTLNAQTNFRVYHSAMLGKSECKSITEDARTVLVDDNCPRRRCNYPNEVCVQSIGGSAFFASTPQYTCKAVPSACMSAVQRGETSGSVGGSQTTRRPTAAPTTTRSTERPTAATTRPPRGGGGGGAQTDARCAAKFGDRGTFGSTRRYARVYGWNGSSCSMYIYFGSGGSSNRFATKSECESACAGASASSSSSSSSSSSNVCSLPSRAGQYNFTQACPGGNRLSRRYAYDASRRQCVLFFYSGCNGNANNFANESECRRACQS